MIETIVANRKEARGCALQRASRACRTETLAGCSPIFSLTRLGLLAGLASLLVGEPSGQCRGAGDDRLPKTTVQQTRLGETDIAVATTEKAGARFVYVNLHDDENTSVEAVRDVVKNLGGRLVELRHTGRRLITFKLDASDYRVDPNRIFTLPACVRRWKGSRTIPTKRHAPSRASPRNS